MKHPTRRFIVATNGHVRGSPTPLADTSRLPGGVTHLRGFWGLLSFPMQS